MKAQNWSPWSYSLVMKSNQMSWLFMLRFDRKQHNSVKQYLSIKKNELASHKSAPTKLLPYRMNFLTMDATLKWCQHKTEYRLSRALLW